MSQENKANLTLNTIQTAVQIIGVCCQRGALKPEEMELVGKTYNDMKNFIGEQINYYLKLNIYCKIESMIMSIPMTLVLFVQIISSVG